MGHVPQFYHGLPGSAPVIAFIRTEMVPAFLPWPGPLDDDVFQGRFQQLHIMPIRSADDEGERDATTVDEQASFGPIFFPDPSGWAQRILTPTVP